MTRVGLLVLLLAALGVGAAACGGPLPKVSGELVWTRADGQEIPVAPGDILRIASDEPVRIVEVVTSSEGEVEVARVETPRNGLVLARASLGATAMRLPPGVVAHTSVTRDPEIGWFDLEREALSWSATPLGTPFPALAAAPRVDPTDLADLDAVLGGSPAGPDARLALREVLALRTLRALQGLRRYPYARNEELSLLPGTKTHEVDERTFVEARPDAPASITVEGPAALTVSSRVMRGAADVVAEVKVIERAHVRGEARGNVRRLASPDSPPPPSSAVVRRGHENDDPTLALFRQIFVHVPPGRHTYQIVAVGAAAWVAAMRTSAFLRVEDAILGRKNEARMLERARGACSTPRSEGPCLIALALAGEDDGPVFDRTSSAAPLLARKLATRISSGAPSDRAAQLEAAAGTGDNGAVATLAREASATMDMALRDSWWRGTSRGTSWETVDDGSEPTWFAFLPREAAAAQCGPGSARPLPAVATTQEHEVDARPATFFALPWRRVRALRLLAVVPCSTAEPLQIEVDGQPLSAQPSSARSLWHVVVRGETAKVRRLDKGPGHVYALSDDACAGHGTLVHAALPLARPRELAFPANATSPGLEVWLEDGRPAQSFTITSNDGRRLDIVAHAQLSPSPGAASPTAGGLVAIDEAGARWRRAGYVPLPPWATKGARTTMAAGVAVRAVVRGVKGEPEVEPTEHARPPSVEALVALSKTFVLARTREGRAAAALERALLLASYGAERAALEDTELATSLGAKSATGEGLLAFVRRALLPMPPTPLEVGTSAYGVEPDFDPAATRCTVNAEGARARLAALDERLRTRSKSAPFDRALAVQAATLAAASPADPRAESVVTLATTSSKWKLLHDVEGGGGRQPIPHEKDQNPILDADGRLRPRIHGGDPFGQSFVSVTPERAAKAFLADLQGAKARLDIVCVPRRAPEPGEKCPLKIMIGQGAVVPFKLGEDARTTVELPAGRGRGKGAELEVSLKPTRGDWVALVRVVLDREMAGTTVVAGVGSVLDTPHIQYRFLLPPGKPIRLRPAAPGLLRVDALPETAGGAADVVVSAGGKEIAVPANGEPKIIPITAAGEVVVSTRSGGATLAIAERAEAPSRLPESDVDVHAPRVVQLDVTAARATFDDGGWRATAESSPRPLTWLEDHAGSLESQTGASASTYRDGAKSDTSLDAHGYQSLTYRRRIESINLFTLGSGLVRVREGEPTYAASLSLYEDLDFLRLRLSGTMGAFSQRINNAEYTLRPRAFVEYSARLASDLFVLPRLGYDGYYTTLDSAPASSRQVDDDLYNAFRFRRNTFVFLQGLLWYVPYFNDIFYLRLRGSYDATNGGVSHASARPGTFLIFRFVEIGAYFDAQYYLATAGARATSSIDTGFGGGVVVHLPVVPGSFEVRPGVTGHVRTDGNLQILGGLTIAASFRRGARDYSSLELSYPEETSGGIPWRSGNKGP